MLHEQRARIRQEAERARAKNPHALLFNLKDSKNAASIVREVAYGLGWRESANVEEDAHANVFWYERAIAVSEVQLLNECQRVNMIPGMHEIAKKTWMARALNRMRALFPADFGFYPQVRARNLPPSRLFPFHTFSHLLSPSLALPARLLASTRRRGRCRRGSRPSRCACAE